MLSLTSSKKNKTMPPKEEYPAGVRPNGVAERHVQSLALLALIGLLGWALYALNDSLVAQAGFQGSMTAQMTGLQRQVAELKTGLLSFTRSTDRWTARDAAAHSAKMDIIVDNLKARIEKLEAKVP